MRDLRALPKAHLHLHFTGSMRHATLVELAGANGVRLPPALVGDWPPRLRATDERGWFRFQRLYDLARSVLRTPADVVRLVSEAVADDAAEGAGWTEIQVDPSGYAAGFGGITAFLELVLDAAGRAAAASGTGVGLVVAASRVRHPLDARTLARLAARYADTSGPVRVVGFGLSNDERRGVVAEFAPAFAIARRAGLLAVPHAGELRGADCVAASLDQLHADRVGHGIRSVEDPGVLARLADTGVTCEVCPASNVALGVYPDRAAVPLRALLAAGVPVALGADDPLLFGSRLLAQYTDARAVDGLSDAELAGLARTSATGSAAPAAVRGRLLAGIEAWLADPDPEPDAVDVGSSARGPSDRDAHLAKPRALGASPDPTRPGDAGPGLA